MPLFAVHKLGCVLIALNTGVNELFVVSYNLNLLILIAVGVMPVCLLRLSMCYCHTCLDGGVFFSG